MSSGRPGLFIGELAAWPAMPPAMLAVAACSIGVSTNPGGILLTVTPVGASSSASDLVNVITPPFEDE